MARPRSELETTGSTDELTIETTCGRLGVEAVTDVARVVVEHAGETAIHRFGRRATVLAAVRLASRRTEGTRVTTTQLEAAFDVDHERITAAEATLTDELSPPADPEEIRAIRRRLVVAREILAALEAGRARPELPGSYLADAAPDLLAGAAPVSDGDATGLSQFDERRLRAHVERLEADLELARLGTTLYALLEDRQ